MTRHDALLLAVALMERHGLKGWVIRFDRAKSRRGSCHYEKRVITVSTNLLPLGREQVESTILHEIAHALVGPTHHHDAVWEAKARELGHSGARCGAAMPVAHAWQATCADCGKTLKRHRLTARVRTQACCPCRRYAAERVLVWRKVVTS